MRLATIGALGLILTAAVFGQTTDPAKLRVKGIGLNSTLSQVKKAFGKPRVDGKPEREECAGGRYKKVEYNGAMFDLMDAVDPKKRTFQVVSFEITSPNFSVSGIKVGDTEHNVRRHLGTNFTKTKDEESGDDQWQYEFTDPDNPGVTNIYISRGKVVKIVSSYLVC